MITCSSLNFCVLEKFFFKSKAIRSELSSHARLKEKEKIFSHEKIHSLYFILRLKSICLFKNEFLLKATTDRLKLYEKGFVNFSDVLSHFMRIPDLKRINLIFFTLKNRNEQTCSIQRRSRACYMQPQRFEIIWPCKISDQFIIFLLFNLKMIPWTKNVA